MSFFNGVGGNGVGAFLSLGSNLGDRENALDRAVQCIFGQSKIRILKISSIYETAPWGIKDQSPFLNMAIAIETGLEPQALLKICKRIEAGLGRKTGVRWGPRAIDIDILLYGGRSVQTPEVEIPHPRLAARRFVMVPLAEIAHDVKVPGFRETVEVLLAQCPDRGDVRLYRKAKGVSE